jgi:hypothetical protein
MVAYPAVLKYLVMINLLGSLIPQLDNVLESNASFGLEHLLNQTYLSMRKQYNGYRFQWAVIEFAIKSIAYITILCTSTY